MLVIGVTNMKEEALCMCQDSSASINGIDLLMAQKSGAQILRLQHPMKALLGNGDEIQANHSVFFKFRMGDITFTPPCYMFPKLKF